MPNKIRARLGELIQEAIYPRQLGRFMRRVLYPHPHFPNIAEDIAKGREIIKDMGLDRGKLAGKRVLDVGAGEQLVALAVGKRAKVHSVDIAYPRWRVFGRTRRMDARRLRYPDDHFDYVILGHAPFQSKTPHVNDPGLEGYIKEDMQRFREGLRVVKRGSPVILCPITEGGRAYFDRFLRRALETMANVQVIRVRESTMRHEPLKDPEKDIFYRVVLTKQPAR